MLCSPTSIFVSHDIALMYCKTILEINSRTNILSRAVLTGNQIDNANTITMKDTLSIISSIGDTVRSLVVITR